MEKTYNPLDVEETIYSRWLENKLFAADENSSKEPYSIVIPPPNVTGILHMGHALNNTVQDILIRWKRMSGCEALWLPGTDHAGIATQNVVERQIARTEHKTRHDLGREQFIRRVWQWKEEYHATITGQLKKLGFSCDWNRERFTMDDGLSRAVRKVFVSLYNDGLIYRGKYIINWCPRCRTALSDEEAEHQETDGKLWYFRYPSQDGNGGVTVATTRPETMLGDTAIAVNPADERYAGLIGTTLVLPLANREIPVVADDFVDREFGTGAVKVTPAHDPNDFQMGLRHKMEPIVVMDERGTMCGPIPDKYIGADRFECRKQVVHDLNELGLVEKITDHRHSVGHCYRCDTVVEPYYSDQWFVKMKPLAGPALAAAKNNQISFYPGRWEKTYIEWMENIRDWCISRQIWWGHRIPVWYCGECGEMIVAEETPAVCPRCTSRALSQDEDVLDTWFSSWLWPFSTMDWPSKSRALEKFYPTNTLVTAPEILFFWVARMIMAGYYCTGKLPFTNVVLHGTVRDKSGRKMSKSLGNAIDPLEIIKTFGADSLRFSLIMITAQGADVYLGKDTFDIGRNFGNKLWNASRFLLGNIQSPVEFSGPLPLDRLAPEDRWILSRLNASIISIDSALNNFRLNETCRVLYDFTWHEFCDWYIEMKKSDLYQDDDEQRKLDALRMCSFVLAHILKLLHPVMPFITEALWGHLRQNVRWPEYIDHEFIMKASFPTCEHRLIDDETDREFDVLKNVITALRTIRSENNIPPDKKGIAVIIPETRQTEEWLNTHSDMITMFARLSSATIDRSASKPSFAGQRVVNECQIFLLLKGLIDKDVEIARLTKEIARLDALTKGAAHRLENQAFINKAPADVIEREKEKYQSFLKTRGKLQKSLESMKAAS
ncbi:MAG: valine--tRNA ligase [Chitinivibrionales bacterium]|nr:valine--tRNA ligase [Chitinivibrionales bacterium]